jgi:hypothetical protein
LLVSKERAKGTAFETSVVQYLRDTGQFPYAERRVLHGTYDKGDITGTGAIVWECKNHKQLRLSEWLVETETERVNANADIGILVVKRKGYGNPAEQYAVLRLEHIVALLKQAGY